MKLRTEIKLLKEKHQFDYQSNIVLLGSCFSENISKKLTYFKFQTFSNPFGILYNPKTIETLILNALEEKEYTSNDVFEHNERWHCFDAHSDVSSSNKETLLYNLNTAVQQTNQQLKKASHIVVTLGTSWVYKLASSNTIVGNCHKIPQKKFLRELLSIEQIVMSLETICKSIRQINPTVHILFTVSPIRHLKDGFVENSQSKSHLISAIHQVVNTGNQRFYFPAYEIMMDDLRDYRFYKSDLIHPNKMAVDYIWEQFLSVWLKNSSTPIMKEVGAIQKGLLHKPFSPDSNQHQLFLAKLQERIHTLEKVVAIRF